ncbi:MAG: hypothetical protein IJS54_01185 [Desulfovibrio sp.]|nr:hypothetical protein [Desulfovibrio sp.]
MNKKTIALCLSCLLYLFFASPVLAQTCSVILNDQSQPKALHRFCKADSNGDDRLSREEFAKGFAGMTDNAFSALDQNRDDAVDLSEWERFLGNHETGKEQKPLPKTMIMPPTP